MSRRWSANPQQLAAHLIINFVAQHPACSTSHLVSLIQEPEPLPAAQFAEVPDAEIAQDGNAAQGPFMGVGVVCLNPTGSDAQVSAIAREAAYFPVIAATGTGEVYDGFSYDLFQFQLRLSHFAAQIVLSQVGEIRVGSGVAADLKTRIREFSKLRLGKKSFPAEKAAGDVKSRAEGVALQHLCRHQKVGFATVIEGD